MNKVFLALIFILISAVVYPQVQKKYKSHGDNKLENGNPTSAIRYYRQAMIYDSNNVDLLFNYAQALRLTNHYRGSDYYFNRVYKEDKKRRYTVALYYMGEMNKYLGDYSASIKYYRRFIKRYKGNKEKYEYLKAKYEDEHYPELAHLIKNELEIEITNEAEVNTGQSEFAGFFISETEMLFSSLRSDSIKHRRVLDTLSYYSRIYSAKNKGTWKDAKLQPDFGENEQFNVANAVYDIKSDYAYYTECEGSHCQIYRARIIDGNLEDYKLLPDKVNFPNSTTTQPYVARIDGFDYLFFSSDRPDGYGKLDIYYVIAYSNGLFDDAVNLGSKINSPGNELCPYYMNEENALYFSSDWHFGLGGFDIFKSKIKGDKFTEIENLGQPFNSSYNDLYFRQRNNQGVLTSNRTGSLTDDYNNCCNDLYFFEFQPMTVKMKSEMSNLEKIDKMLPLRLFFDNDQPNPKSRDTSTSIIYSATYINYVSKIGKYEHEYSKGLKGEAKEESEEEIKNFFDNDVELGYNDLETALVLLEEELKKGTKLELTIKGYASPLSKSMYNKNLTLRRISSIENELLHFNAGALKNYMDNNQLLLKCVPYGEDLASGSVSDDLNDKRNAIYSKKAAFERRVEVIAVQKL